MKCRNCGKEIEKQNSLLIGKNSYYCNEECYNTKMQKRNKDKQKYKPIEDTVRRELTDYIQEIYLENGYDKSEIDWKLLMSQTKNMMEENPKWGYDTILYILHYMKETAEVNLFDERSNTILSLVPYYAMSAQKYCEEIYDCQQIIDNFNFENKKNIIKKYDQNMLKKKYKQIDLTKL